MAPTGDNKTVSVEGTSENTTLVPVPDKRKNRARCSLRGQHTIEMAPTTDNQTVCIEETSKNTTLVHVPVKRKNRARWASLVIFLITAVLVLAFSVVSGIEDEFYPVKDVEATRTNETSPVLYEKREKKSYRGFFTSALTFFSVIIGALFHRLSLVVEEIYHVDARYGGKYKKMLKACFSGLAWKPVLLGMIFAAIIIIMYVALTEINFKLEYLVLVFSGIGFGPLVLHLLNLDTQSEVHISTIMEKKQTYVANGLAWSYYFNDLRKVLPKLQHAIERSAWKDRLSSSKLAILIPLDCNIFKNLHDVDKRFRKEGTIRCQQETAYSVDVFSVRKEGTQRDKYFLIKYAKPLETIFHMSNYERIAALPENKREDEAKLFYGTLKEIINRPLDLNCKDTCVLVSYEPTGVPGNDELVNSILSTVCNTAATLSRGSTTGSYGVVNEVAVSDGRRLRQETAPMNDNVGARDQTRSSNRSGEINVNSETTGESQVQNQPNRGSSHGTDSQTRVVDNIRGQRSRVHLTGNQPHSNQPTQLNRTNQAASNETQANGRNPTSTRQITNLDETMQPRSPNRKPSHVVTTAALIHQNREPQQQINTATQAAITAESHLSPGNNSNPQVATGDSEDTATSNEGQPSDIVNSRETGLLPRAECSGNEIENGEQSYEVQKTQNEEDHGKDNAFDMNETSGEGQHEVTYRQGNRCGATAVDNYSGKQQMHPSPHDEMSSATHRDQRVGNEL